MGTGSRWTMHAPPGGWPKAIDEPESEACPATHPSPEAPPLPDEPTPGDVAR